MGKKARLENRAKRKAAAQAERERIRIVIGTVPDGLSLEREIALIKPALIYGDRVVLCSPTATFLKEMAAFGTLSGRDQMQTMVEIAVRAGLLDAEVMAAPAFVEAIPHLLAMEGLPPELNELLASEEVAQLQEFGSQLRESVSEMAATMEQQFREAGGDELRPALECGALEIEQLLAPGSDDVDDVLDALIDRVTAALRDGRSYVLCDESLGSIVTATTQDLQTSSPALRRARHVGTGAGLLAELPSFPLATVAEALDIRRELDPAVKRFRAAMAELEADVAHVDPRCSEFAEEVRLLWHANVQPELLDLEERVRTNTYLRQLTRDPKETALVALTGLGVALGTGDDVLKAVGAAAGALGDAAVRKAAESRSIKRHRLFLLHATEERLRK